MTSNVIQVNFRNTYRTLPLSLTPRSISFAFLFLSLLAAHNSPLFAAFEQLGAGARPIGMGSAFTAISDDPHAIYYNPAGLAQVRRGEITAAYGKLFVGLKDNSNLGSGFVGMAQPIKQGKLGTAGIGWVSLSLNDAYREDTVSFSYGKETWRGLFIGGTGKVLKRSFGSDPYTQVDPLFIKNGQNTTSLAFDFGLLYRPSASYSFALAFQDLNQPEVGLAKGDKLPLEIRGGFGYHQRQLIFDAEIARKDKDTNVSMGLEKWLFTNIGLRAGFNVGSRNKREIATGMGYKGEHFSLDYAFVFPLAGVESTAGSHRFGFSLRFGQAPERARWEFEDVNNAVERLLEQKSAQIDELERQLEELRSQGQAGKLDTNWTRQQIKRLEEKLKEQESKELDGLKSRLLESRLETEKMKRQIQEMQDRIQKISTPRPAQRPAVITEPKPQAPVPSIPRSYTVQDGDTLQSIAQKFYEDPGMWMEIYELNADRIERGGTVRAGQFLILPEKR